MFELIYYQIIILCFFFIGHLPVFKHGKKSTFTSFDDIVSHLQRQVSVYTDSAFYDG